MDNGLVRCEQPGHGSGRVLVRDGFIGRAPRRRQRWRCRSAHDREDFHRFVPRVPRLEALEHRCLDCESGLDVAQGPNAARRYDFVAREVAAALVAVANGATYQQAALTARQSVAEQHARVGRPVSWNDNGMRHGQAAADWVEVFTDVVLAGTEDTSWPEVVLLGSTSFWRRSGGRQVPAFHVLLAYGYDAVRVPSAPAADELDEDASDLLDGEDFDNPWTLRPVKPQVHGGRLLQAHVFRRSDTASWTAFLTSWPGQPQVVVADRAPEPRAGVAAAWNGPAMLGRPEFVHCRWHLAKNLRAAVAEDLADLDPRQLPRTAKLASARTHPVHLAAPQAFDTPTTWRAFDDLARIELDDAHLRLTRKDGRLSRTRRWLTDNELLVLTQQARRPDRLGPEATGPLEAEIHSIRGTLHRRAQTLRNRPRTNLLLRLVVAGRRGQANDRLWAEKVRSHLEALDGIPQQQRRMVERRGAQTL